MKVGKLLGRGRYSQVHEVVSFGVGQVGLTAATDSNIATVSDAIINTAATSATGEKDEKIGNQPHVEEQQKQQPTQQHPEQQQQQQGYVMKHLSKTIFQKRGHRCSARDLTNALADLVLEAMYLSKLRHPNIIRLRGLTLGGTAVLQQKGAVAEDYFLILDRMDQTLDHRIVDWRTQPRANASISEVLTKTFYAFQIADALSYLHDHQILYRDLKPENIGLVKVAASLLNNRSDTSQNDDEEGPRPATVQLFDFGLARELDEPVDDNSKRLYTMSASGTRRYMAPEIFNPPGKYSYMADVYSFGMVFYEMLALQKPFADFTCQSHEELVCRLGGRPRMGDIPWPHQAEDKDGMDLPTTNKSQRLTETIEKLLHQTWMQDFHKRPTIRQVHQHIGDILDTYGFVYKRQDTVATTSSGSSLQRHFQCQNQDIPIFLQKKTSTSELTGSTDPMVSDSELDDDTISCLQQRVIHCNDSSCK